MTSRHSLVHSVAASAVLASLAFASAVAAAPAPEKTAAEMLDAEGTALMQQRRYADACPKLAESERLSPGTGVLLRLGLCDEAIGKTASAWSAFREASARAQRSGDEALRQLAQKRADEIAPRVPRVSFVVSPGPAMRAVTLLCDGVALDPSAASAEIPRDPGPHVVEASRGGRAVFRKAFALAARGEVVRISIDIPPEEPTVRTEAPPSPASSSAHRTAAIVAGGVGVAGLIVGSVFGLVALSSWDHARSECTGTLSGCSQDALDSQSGIRTEATVSTVGFVVGAAGIAGTAVLWWTAPKQGRDPSHAAAMLRPSVRANGFGLELAGSF